MRLFVAVYPPAAALSDLAATVDRLRIGTAAAAGASVGLTARPLWHVTLVFLGDVADERVPAAAEALAGAVDRWRSGSAPTPRLRLAGGGKFGRGRFTIMWAGLDGDVAGLRELARHVRRGMRHARFTFDDRRPLHPHLTIGRPGARLPADDIEADLAALDRYRGPWWQVEAVHLVSSRPGPKPVYQSMSTVSLDP